MNTCELESQDSTKVTSASADSHVNFSWVIMSFLGENIVFVFGSYDHFSQCFSFVSQLGVQESELMDTEGG